MAGQSSTRWYRTRFPRRSATGQTQNRIKTGLAPDLYPERFGLGLSCAALSRAHRNGYPLEPFASLQRPYHPDHVIIQRSSPESPDDPPCVPFSSRHCVPSPS